MMDPREALSQIAAILCPNAVTFTYDEIVRAVESMVADLETVNRDLDLAVQRGAALVAWKEYMIRQHGRLIEAYARMVVP